ncbi:MAG: pyrroloquinoline quinone biosynthesis peptide chaperone PqqD [Proteobacteria bacterium]|nr:pyrroloquinoline quinone biosynthesis peptide chaperone PqqD [Pseudomonadota bacterium]
MHFDAATNAPGLPHPSPPALPHLSRHLQLHYEAAQARWVLIAPDSMVQLNDSAAEILRRCDGRRTVANIVNELETLFDTRGIAPQVQELLAESWRRGWFD